MRSLLLAVLLVAVPLLLLLGVVSSGVTEAVDLVHAFGWLGLVIYAAVPLVIWGLATRFPSRHGHDRDYY